MTSEPAGEEARPYPVTEGRHPDFVRLGGRFERALDYAADMHREQGRKGSPTPYLAHLVGVAALVLEYGGDETQAVAALLHDTLEDCGAAHAPRIEEAFGSDVLAIVVACTDYEGPPGVPKPPWRPRKERYLAHLAALGAGHPALLVSCADKLHNARSIRADLRQCGRSLWERFSAPAEQELWYYESLVGVFTAILGGPLPGELRRTVADIARIDAALSG